MFDDCVFTSLSTRRAKTNHIPTNRKSSNCFNLKAIAKQINPKSFSELISFMISRNKLCTPVIKINGDIVLGESDLCPKCCSIYDSEEIVLKSILTHKCNGCHEINDKLPEIYKQFL